MVGACWQCYLSSATDLSIIPLLPGAAAGGLVGIIRRGRLVLNGSQFGDRAAVTVDTGPRPHT
jgi:hypothetical protein